MKIMWEMTKRLIILLIIMSLSLINTIPVFALTTADVTVTATPAYVSISSNGSSYNFGTVASSGTFATPTSYFVISNTSSVSTNVTISVTTTTWSGGTTWTHSETNTPGADTAGLASSNGTAAFDVIIKNGTPNKIYTNLPTGLGFPMEIQLKSPTSYSDGTQKTIVVRLTASS